MALRAARAHAALQGRTAIAAVDTAMATRLVLGPRALEDGDPTPSPAPQARDETQSGPPTDKGDTPSDPEEPAAADGMQTVVAAIDAALPDDLLERAVAGPTRAPPGRAGGAGGTAKSTARGRPAGWRSGALRAGDRLNLIETLRAAAPWQALRNRSSATSSLQIRASDFRVRRFVQRPQSTTIFVVDASGSTALQRLAEAKGAVELLLAKAYVSRSHVALIAFRGAAAETLLAPTRSLTRARNCLADLPGGGGTPLAAAIHAALSLACAEAARNRLPRLVFLTDGAANIAGDGSPGRSSSSRRRGSPRSSSTHRGAPRRRRQASLKGCAPPTPPCPISTPPRWRNWSTNSQPA
jgi:magnesium chelatase subunit D